MGALEVLFFRLNTLKIAGTKKIDRRQANNVPSAVKIPKSTIISRYDPKIKEIKPMMVVNAARIIGIST